MGTLAGKRVNSLEEVWEDGVEPGVYFPVLAENQSVKALWFRMPTGCVGRIAGKGHGNGDEPEWDITINADGTVTVDPSIENHEIRSEGVITVPYWHGHLRDGVWTD